MAKITLVDTSCLLSFFLLLLADLSCCKEILVGGKHTAWKISSSPSDSLNKWAESLRFHVVWKYDGQKDSVLQVTKEAYINCNTTNPAASKKLHIVVMSSRGSFFTGGSAPSPAPSPALLEAQAVPPANGSASSLTSRIGFLAFVGLATVLL
ncbi:hypothetical protein HID58_001456 [Brassica napus]|uniref:Phytocyanin domain-containing protein n=2 Tax=Brassica napus TaxID=3708 RepID=A0ABQ8EJF4_BRANA|nr:hypothetical protein HID58_001456 [Brassica napus]